MNNLISVIIPVYNVEKYLPKCIESVINQTYKNIEIIVIDDGSTDTSGDICNEYSRKDKRIKVIHKKNGGVSSARNMGLDNSTGEFITFVDSDDYIEVNYCEKLLAKLKQEDVDCVACGYNRVYDNKIEKIVSKKSYMLDNIEFLEKILFVQSGLGFCHMKLWKKNTIQKIRFNEKLKVGEDAFFNVQASRKIRRFYMINEPLYNYRFNEKSVVRNYDKDYVYKYLSSMQEMNEYIFKEYHNNKNILKKVNNYISYHVLLIVVNYCSNPENGLTIREQVKELKRICKIEEFNTSIKKTSYKGFSITRKITLFTLKCKLYYFTMIIGKIRQIQFNNRKNM